MPFTFRCKNNILNACLALVFFDCISAAPVKAQNLVPDPSFESVTEDTTQYYDVIEPLVWIQGSEGVYFSRKSYPENHSFARKYSDAFDGKYYVRMEFTPFNNKERKNKTVWIDLTQKIDINSTYKVSFHLCCICPSEFNYAMAKISCPQSSYTKFITMSIFSKSDNIVVLNKNIHIPYEFKSQIQSVPIRKKCYFKDRRSPLPWEFVCDTFKATVNGRFLAVSCLDIFDFYGTVCIDYLSIEKISNDEQGIVINRSKTDSLKNSNELHVPETINQNFVFKEGMLKEYMKADSLFSAEQYPDAKEIYSDLLKKSAIPDSNDQNLDMIEGNTLYSLAICNTKLGLPFDSVAMYISQAIDSGYYAFMELFHDYKTFGEFTFQPEWSELLQKNTQGQCNINLKINCKIYTEMTNMYFRDQLIRNKLFANENDSIKKKEILIEMNTIDSLNLLRLIPILDKYGYPGDKLVGSTASHYGIFILTHSDRETIAKYLGLVDMAFEKDDVNGMMVCLLINRMMVLNNKEILFNSNDTRPKKAKHLKKELKRIGIEGWEKYQQFYL